MSQTILIRHLWRLCLTALLIVLPLSVAKADGVDGAAYVNVGWNQNPATRTSVGAGIQFDLRALKMNSNIRIQTFDIGLGYDRVQGKNGATADFRVRIPVFRCYGWESDCQGKRFWITAVPFAGGRLGGGGLRAFAAAQIEAVFDPSRGDSCCRIALGFQHRFPFDSSLHNDNAITLELRTFIGFVDPQRRPVKKD